jgi:trk system potassium uptake protein TrkH
MLYGEISCILGRYLLLLAGALLVPLGVSIYYDLTLTDSHSVATTQAFTITFVICLALAGVAIFGGRKATGALHRREGLILVVVIWFISAFIGALPFKLSGTLQNFTDAYFEATSGFTTNGATILQAKNFDPITGEEIPLRTTVASALPVQYTYYGTVAPLRDANGKIIRSGVEAVSRGLLFWRSFMQWIGGIGIVVILMTILPTLGVGGKVIYETEVAGPLKSSLAPRLQDTAILLAKVYVILTLIQIGLLLATNPSLPLFDAVNIGFATISTGGFSIRNNGIADYHSEMTEWIVIVFMIIGSISFVHYVNIAHGKLRRLLEPELVTFLLILCIGSAIIALNLFGTPKIPLTDDPAQGVYSLTETIRYSIFQFVSTNSTTGYATANIDHWPFLSQALLLVAMWIGGMSTSTAGGIKIMRHMILFRVALQKIELVFRPRTVSTLQIGHSAIDIQRASTILCYFLIVIALSVAGTLLFIANGIDPDTAISAIGCFINNTGIGFRAAGPADSFAFMPFFSKIVAIIWMVLGRLEFFALLILFIPAFWRGE